MVCGSVGDDVELDQRVEDEEEQRDRCDSRCHGVDWIRRLFLFDRYGKSSPSMDVQQQDGTVVDGRMGRDERSLLCLQILIYPLFARGEDTPRLTCTYS